MVLLFGMEKQQGLQSGPGRETWDSSVAWTMKQRFYRAWTYARIGYPVYISFFVAIGGNLVIVARLLFPGLNPFVFTAIGGGCIMILASLLGWIHTKKIAGMKTDYEINPYNYLLLPGKEREALYPLLMAIAEKLEVNPVLVDRAREIMIARDIKRINWKS